MLSVGTILGRLVGLLGQILGITTTANAHFGASAVITDPVAHETKPPMVPAVAGYVKRIEFASGDAQVKVRIEPVDLMLPQRLASVATLNTRAGRKPRSSGPVRQDSIIPLARVGAKKQRATPRGSQVLRPHQTRMSAQILEFPSGAALAQAQAKAELHAQAA